MTEVIENGALIKALPPAGGQVTIPEVQQFVALLNAGTARFQEPG